MPRDFSVWWDDIFFQMSCCNSEDEISIKLLRMSRELGFTNFAFGYIKRIPFAKKDIFLKASYPEQWTLRYDEQRYAEVDPTLRPCFKDGKLMIWSDDLFINAKQLWTEAKSVGISVGISQPCWDVDGTYGVCSLSRDGPEISIGEQAYLKPFMLAFAELSMSSFRRFHGARLKREHSDGLTLREIEILRWTADGKSAKAIGNALHISHHTVNFHLANCMQKFNCSSKIQVACEAVALGIL